MEKLILSILVHFILIQLCTQKLSASPKYADIFPTYLSVKLKWWLHSITFRTRNLGKNNFYYNEYILNMSILSLV